MYLESATWKDIEALRNQITAGVYPHVAAAAQAFVDAFTERFESVVLARVFLVLPLKVLPDTERDFAQRFVSGDARLESSTHVLALLGSAGHEASYQGRLRSSGHLAIPLLDRKFVQGIPMIAKLLADLEVDLRSLDDGRPIATRRMLGGHNAIFYIPDAATARDELNRPIIPAQDFVRVHGITTVLGMGGAYVDGTLAVAILFTRERLDRATTDRYASFISTFKTATASLLQQGAIYSAK